MDQRLLAVRLMILDVDGVMTDGRLHYSETGEELKAFNTLDGLGLKMLKSTGVEIAIITARTSKIVERRASELGVDFLFQGVHDKRLAFDRLLPTANKVAMQCAYMGDDLPDLPVMIRVAFAITVPNAPQIVQDHAHYVTAVPGGRGAVREAAEVIMKAQNTFDGVLAPYLI